MGVGPMTASVAPDSSVLRHQTSNPFAADVDIATGKRRVHPPGAIGLTRVFVDLGDCLHDLSVRE
jgi:hypothetical protein